MSFLIFFLGVNPGSCSPYSSPGRFARCEDECQTDADCGRTNKCCPSTCIGKKCMAPSKICKINLQKTHNRAYHA